MAEDETRPPGPASDGRGGHTTRDGAAAAQPSGGEPTPAPQPDGEPGGAPDVTPRLTALDRAVLAFERRGWPDPGAKERAVRERFGISPTRYYHLLNTLLDDPRALAHDPVTVNRLRRLREQRRRRR